MAYIGNNPAELVTELDNGVVTTTKLANDAVTAAKIVDGTIVADDLATGIITNAAVAANAAIAATKLAVSGGSNITLTSDGTFNLDATVDVTGGYSVSGNAVITSARAVNMTSGSTTGDFSFGDSDKAIFGAGSDLQIYHDGSSSHIVDNGEGNLRMQGVVQVADNPSSNDGRILFGDATNASGIVHYDYSAGDFLFENTWANAGADFVFKTNNVNALTISPTGINVTGTAIVGGNVGVNKAVNSAVGLSVGSDAASTTSYGLEVCNNNANTKFIVDGLGNSSFFGSDNSLTATFSSGGNVGIAVSNPDYPLVVQSSSGGNTIKMIGRSADSISGLVFANTGNTAVNYIQGDSSFIRARADGGFHFRKGGTPVTTDTGAFTVNDLNVGIGTNTPAQKLVVQGSNHVATLLNTSTANNAYAQLMLQAGSSTNYIWTQNQNSSNYGGANSLNLYTQQASPIVFFTNGNNERLRINGDGTPYALDIGGGYRFSAKSELTQGAYWIGSTQHGFRFNNNADSHNNVIMHDNGNMTVRGQVSAPNLIDVANSNVQTTTANQFMTVQNTVAGGYSEMALRNNNNDYIVMGSIGTGYTNVSWADSSYIYANRQLRIKSNAAIRFYSGNIANGIKGAFEANGSFYLYSQVSGTGNATLKYATGSGQVTYDTSSRLVKDQIESIPYGLSAVMALSPKRYERTDSDNQLEVGFIADEVVEVIPELVGMMEKRFLTMNDEDTEMVAGSVSYDKMSAVIVKAIQEQQATIAALNQRIETLENN